MAYIGARPLIGNYQICDAITASATADYTLQVGSVNVVPESANAMIVSLNSVIQGPGASRGFTVSGSTISFNSTLSSSDVIDFIYIFGDVLDIGTPTDGTVTAAKLAADAVTTAKILDDNVTTAKILDDNVTTAKIADNNVTLAKLADGTQGDILYYGASGAPTLLGYGTSGDFLKTQGTGANPAWDTVAAADVVLITTQTLGSDSATWSIDGFYSATYTNYLYHMYDYWCSNAGNQIELQFNASASALATSHYRHVSWRAYMESGSSGSGVQGGYTAAHVTFNTGSGVATQLASMQLMVWDPLATDTYKTLTYMAGNDENTQLNVKFGHCMYTTGDTTAHSGITLTQGGSGDIKAGMKIKIYGYK